MASLTLEYKRSDEYKTFRQHILNDIGDTFPEYLIDMAVSLHLAKPFMYRDGLLKPKVPAAFETLDGHVTVENPEPVAAS